MKIDFGIDVGTFHHSFNGNEFAYMVEAGMPAMKAIQSTTVTNAKVLKNDAIGEISSGKYADIIAVNEDPIININTIENVIFVMNDGVIYKNDSY